MTAEGLTAAAQTAAMAAAILAARQVPAFSVYRSGGQTISTFATIAADAEEYDTHNAVASGVFTAPVAGYYQFNGYAGGATTPTTTQLRFSKNSGAAYYYGGTYPTGNLNSASASALILLAANDTVALQLFLGASQSITTGIAGNFFQGFLVRPT